MKMKKLLNKLLKRTRNESFIREISFENLCKLIKSNADIILVDTRSPQEFAENRISGSVNIPEYELLRNATRLLPDKNALIILYCQSGDRSRKAYITLARLGYTNLYDLKGGLDNI